MTVILRDIGRTADRYPIRRVEVPAPALGGKCFLIEEKGIFVLEVGPGSLGTIACTHAGAGGIQAIDGIPDENGFFPGQDDPAREAAFNGRPLFHANPAVMGSWWLNGGFHHGLTIVAMSGHQSVNVVASVVWTKVKLREAKG